MTIWKVIWKVFLSRAHRCWRCEPSVPSNPYDSNEEDSRIENLIMTSFYKPFGADEKAKNHIYYPFFSIAHH